MENFAHDPIVEIDILYNSCVIFNIRMKGDCTLGQIQIDLLHGDVELPKKYQFMVNRRKVFTQSFQHLCQSSIYTN